MSDQKILITAAPKNRVCCGCGRSAQLSLLSNSGPRTTFCVDCMVITGALMVEVASRLANAGESGRN